MEKITGAAYIVAKLLDFKIEVVFSYPGGPVLPLYPLFEKNGIRVVQCRHEQDGFHMAQGYARASGKFGVMIVTSGPGLTNSITGMADAYADSTPVLLIAGQVSSDGFDDFQASFNTSLVQTVAGAIEEPKRISDLPSGMHRVLECLISRSKPALLSMHAELMYEIIEDSQIEFPNSKQTKAVLDSVDLVVEEIRKKSKIFFLFGGGVVLSKAQDLATNLVDSYRFAFGFSLMGVGSVERKDKNGFGLVGSYGNYNANNAISEADLVIVVGSHLSTRTTCKPDQFCPKATIVHVDLNSHKFNMRISTDINIQSDASAFLKELSRKIDLLSENDRNFLKEKNDAFVSLFGNQSQAMISEMIGEKLHPEFAIKSILDLIPSNMPVSCDVGQHQMWVAKNFKGNRLFMSANHGTMGFSIPCAIGVGLANSNSTTVYSIVGDGGFQMSIPQLSLLNEESLKIIIIVINNSSLGMIRQTQNYSYGIKDSFAFKTMPNLEYIAAAYNISYKSIKQPSDIYGISELLKFGKESTLIEVMVDGEISCLPRVPSGRGLKRMITE